MSRQWLRAAQIACLLLPLPVFAARITVSVDGAVAQAATLTLTGHARLSDAALAAHPLPDAYMLGAAWLRPQLLDDQRRLKAGVLFDLRTLQQQASQHGKTELARIAGVMQASMGSMPVTGREAALLDPRAVEAAAAQNHPLADGDQLYYPQRPRTIRVVGAVQKPCELPLVPLQDARDYLAACPSISGADRDSLFVIQPDGRVFVEGIALWNRGAAQPLAPGAILYVPINARVAQGIDATFNRDVAAFLATQLLPGPAQP